MLAPLHTLAQTRMITITLRYYMPRKYDNKVLIKYQRDKVRGGLVISIGIVSKALRKRTEHQVVKVVVVVLVVMCVVVGVAKSAQHPN